MGWEPFGDHVAAQGQQFREDWYFSQHKRRTQPRREFEAESVTATVLHRGRSFEMAKKSSLCVYFLAAIILGLR